MYEMPKYISHNPIKIGRTALVGDIFFVNTGNIPRNSTKKTPRGTDNV